MTVEELLRCMPCAGARAQIYIEPLSRAMTEFEIAVKPQRAAAFLAQVAHESGSLNYVREIASGAAYEGRADLGNVEPGDGVRFRGRGLIQVTGRANNRDCGDALGLDLLGSPELLELPLNAARSAGWYWHSRGLNALADRDLFGAITKKINGGYNGLDDRIAHWLRARKFFGI